MACPSILYEISSAGSDTSHGQAKSKSKSKSNAKPSQINELGSSTTSSEAPNQAQNLTSSSALPSAHRPSNAHPEVSAEVSPTKSLPFLIPSPTTPLNSSTCLHPSHQPSPLPKPLDFEAYYLQKVTAEFADDIDKVRNANDFKESSVPILIEALRQGAVLYGEEERKRVMGGTGS